MPTNDTNSDKTGGFRDPATAIVELDGETITIDAAHHITNDRAQLLHLYVDERAGGIDVTVPIADSDAKAWARSDVGREALGLDTDDDDQDATVTPGSQVEYRGEPWMVIETSADGTHALLDARSDAARDMCPTSPAAGDCPTVSASIDEVTVIVQHTGGTPLAADGGGNDDGDDDSDDGRLMTDGGRDVPPCSRCGADLLDTAEIATEYGPASVSRHPRMIEVPAAECECGASVGAQYGMDAVVAIWEARGESPPDRDDGDGDDDSDDGRLMTDGGIDRRDPGAHEGRPAVPDTQGTVVDLDAVDRGDAVTTIDGTVVGHVIVTRVAEMHQYPDEYAVKYVTADGERTRAEVYGTRQIPVCSRCGDIVVQPGGGVASSHDDGCNGGD